MRILPSFMPAVPAQAAANTNAAGIRDLENSELGLVAGAPEIGNNPRPNPR
jgi:hypothetical protein